MCNERKWPMMKYWNESSNDDNENDTMIIINMCTINVIMCERSNIIK